MTILFPLLFPYPWAPPPCLLGQPKALQQAELFLLAAPLLLAASQSLAYFRELDENGSLLQHVFHDRRNNLHFKNTL